MPNCTCSPNVAVIKTVLVLFMQTMYALGTLKSIGVYVPKLIEGLGLTPTHIGLSLGLFGAFAFIPGPFITYFYQRLHGVWRWILVMTGAVLAPLALIAGGFVTNSAQLAFCLSAAGLGSNILSIAIVITLRNQCSEHFGIYYGIGKSGYALGMALVPLLADYLMELYGWRGSIMMIGALMAHLIPLTMMVDINVEAVEADTVRSGCNSSDDQRIQVDTEDKIHEETNNDNGGLLDKASNHDRGSAASDSSDNLGTPGSSDTSIEQREEPLDEVNDETISDTTKLLEESSLHQRQRAASAKSRYNEESTSRTGYTELYDNACQILKNSVYNRDRWMIHLMLVTFVYSMVNGTWNGFLIPRAVDRGFVTTVAVSFAYSAAVGAFIGRFFGGFILSLNKFSNNDWFFFLTLVNIGSLLADIFVDRFGLMLVTSFISCLTLAERSTQVLVICTNRVTQSEFPLILASSEIVFGIGTFIGAFLAGFITYAYGSFNASYVFVAAADAVVFCLMIPPTIAEKRSNRPTTEGNR